MDPFLILGAIAMISGWCITLGSIWFIGARTMRRFAGIESVAMPLMSKASKALDETAPVLAKVSAALDTFPDLGNIDAIPATMVAGLEKVIKEQLEVQGSPLRTFTAEILNQTTAIIDERIATFAAKSETLTKLLPAAQTILSKAGVEGKADKKEGRETVAALIESFGPAKGIIEKFVPASKREDPAEFLSYLAKMKGTISAFSPGIGQMLDGYLEQAIMGGNASAGIFGGTADVPGLVNLTPRANPAASTVDSYGR